MLRIFDFHVEIISGTIQKSVGVLSAQPFWRSDPERCLFDSILPPGTGVIGILIRALSLRLPVKLSPDAVRALL